MSDQAQTVVQAGKVIVGVTGNIATGKSAVMRLARDKAALTIDADAIVHDIMDNDAHMQAAIAVAFGAEVRLPDGRINRRALGKIVFNDPSALRDLEQIVHPATRAAIAQRIHDTDKPVIFLEAIKLLESPLRDLCHQIWVTRCPRQRQLERLMICRGMDGETATRRIETQSPQEEKVAQADVVIDTAGLMRETEAQFEMAWARLPAPETAAPITLHLMAADAAGMMAGPAAAPAAKAKPAAPTAPPKAKPGIGLERPIPKSLKQRLGKKLDRPAAATKPAAAPSGASPEQAAAVPPAPAKKPAPAPTAATPGGAEIRRARPSDIPTILLLLHRATNGAMKLKRADLLMALGERSYFIGQVGREVQAVAGWNIENLVGRITELYFHPETAVGSVGPAMLAEIEQSADRHICEILVAFLPHAAPAALKQLFANQGYAPAELEKMPHSWRGAIRESQPENTDFVIKILRERVTHPI
ncbi:MAG: dephospho-CoA kinase [Anaerolineales bacterium]|nr:dephospho-CoA kinase [Anaerolineales bacterium]